MDTEKISINKHSVALIMKIKNVFDAKRGAKEKNVKCFNDLGKRKRESEDGTGEENNIPLACSRAINSL